MGDRSAVWRRPAVCRCFFFTDTPPTEIYTLSLHDALPIRSSAAMILATIHASSAFNSSSSAKNAWPVRSEEHTSELQSLAYLVCRLLLEKKKKFNALKPNPVTAPLENLPAHIRTRHDRPNE